MEEKNVTIKNLQADEMEALAAIFGDEFILQGDRTFSIKILNSSGNEFILQVVFPDSYPLYSSPKYEISAPWMERKLKNRLCEELKKICSHHKGECIIYMWTNLIKDFIEQDSFLVNCATEEENTPKEEDVSLIEDEVPTIIHGETIKDRKSVFQAHFAKVVSIKQVNQALEKLKENKKVASAEHNIYAYRIKSDQNGKIIQDCDDDGEAKAGPVLLHLLEVLDLADTLIVVSRWFGGTLLGPIRYRHIGDAAKSLIDQLGLIKNEKIVKSSGSRSKSQA